MISPSDPVADVEEFDRDLDTVFGRSRAGVAFRVVAGVLGCVALSGIAFAVDAANRSTADAFDITGSVIFDGHSTSAAAGACALESEPDPAPTVTVSTEAGTTVSRDASIARTESGVFRFDFEVPDVPHGHATYHVAVSDISYAAGK